MYLSPINWHLTAPEVGAILRNSETSILFASRRTEDLARSALSASGREVPILLVDEPGPGSLDQALEGMPTQLPVDQREGVYLFFSSGTTGRPKGIRPQHSFGRFGQGLGIDRLVASPFGFDDGVVYLSPSPLYQTAPLS